MLLAIETYNQLLARATEGLNGMIERKEYWEKMQQRAAHSYEDAHAREDAITKFHKQLVEREKEMEMLTQFIEKGSEVIQEFVTQTLEDHQQAYDRGFQKGRESLTGIKYNRHHREAFRAAWEGDTIESFKHLY